MIDYKKVLAEGEVAGYICTLSDISSAYVYILTNDMKYAYMLCMYDASNNSSAIMRAIREVTNTKCKSYFESAKMIWLVQRVRDAVIGDVKTFVANNPRDCTFISESKRLSLEADDKIDNILDENFEGLTPEDLKRILERSIGRLANKGDVDKDILQYIKLYMDRYLQVSDDDIEKVIIVESKSNSVCPNCNHEV